MKRHSRTTQNQGNTNNENIEHNNRGRNYRQNANSIILNIHFEGTKPELGGVLTLRTEKVKHKFPYQVFKDK